jgi:hypothetical protein
MVTHFITVLDGVITGQHAGDFNAEFAGTPYHNHKRVEIPRGASVAEGDRLEFYDENWKRKPNIQLIDEGLMQIPEGYVREENGLRPMTAEERVIAGLDAPQPGTKVENGEIVPMPLAEQLEAGQITREEYESRMANENSAELQRRLGELLTPEALAQAELDAEFAAERKTKLAALLAVKKQEGWPVSAEWPG